MDADAVEIELTMCPKCGLMKPRSQRSPHICVDCERVINNRYSIQRVRNDGWQDIAKDSGLELWERQPKETQLEWSIWQAYRDTYPGAKPSYRWVAEKIGTTYDFVVTTARRWDFQVRMQAWITECDKITVAQRRREILDMNKEHIDMASRLRAKLSKAIDLVDPESLAPKDLNSLLKTVAELEKKARLDTLEQEQAIAVNAHGDEDTSTEGSTRARKTDKSDLSEVVQILLSAGALGDITTIGVRKTETTEVVVKE